mgnify:CR=1 FL=1|jgi:hypothetical protein
MTKSSLKFENTICKIDGCSKNIRLKSYGVCSMHETRFRTNGTFEKTEKIKQVLELPNGIKITKEKDIELFKIILEEVKHRRLCGYWYETGERISQKDTVRYYIASLLNDEIKGRRGNTKSGIRTTRMIGYLDSISEKYDKKWGLISENCANSLCNIVKIVCDDGFCTLTKLERMTYDPDELLDIIKYEKIHGLKYDDSKIIEFADSGEQILEKNKLLKDQINGTLFPRDFHLINLHYERFLSQFTRKK